MPVQLRTIVFDLDGTLYIDENLAREIQQAASSYVGRIRNISPAAAAQLIMATRQRLTREHGSEATISAVCSELGGTASEFHETATSLVHPEAWLREDRRVTALLTDLARRFQLVIYTNNNRTLTEKILCTLGISRLFSQCITIEDFWQPKPDRGTLLRILEMLGRHPEECLFVGDRFDVDLRIPAELGCAVRQVTCTADLLALAALTETV